MKYGPIICDPNSEEAKKLIGKFVEGADSYLALVSGVTHKQTEVGILAGICTESDKPFSLDMKGIHLFKDSESVTFIREVIEEEPQYRPYKDTEEMVEDFKKRFCKHTTIPQYSMPLIWLNNRNIRCRFLVATFGDDAVHLNGNEIYSWMNMKDLFRYMTYLDGSPVGKEEA